VATISALELTKHEGAGNDFLVLIDVDDTAPMDGPTVVALCDRSRGVGADGVIRVGPGRHGTDLSMELRNADGGPAEMSGNGMRCLAQAAVDAGLVAPPRFTVATVAGLRTVDFERRTPAGHDWAAVDMGPARLGPEPATGGRARYVDVGNPHLVIWADDPAEVDVARLGPQLSAAHPGGLNVEWIAAGPGPDRLVLRVWERGAGETRACGTGSVAAAAAARDWGEVGPVVVVDNPGGPLEVTLGAGPDGATRLAGPVRKVADVTVDRAWLA
jgi:diaminopimelate epimerase